MLLCASCDRSGRSAWPELAPGLTPESTKQKYAQTVVSTPMVPGSVPFLGGGKAFLHSLDPYRKLASANSMISSARARGAWAAQRGRAPWRP